MNHRTGNRFHSLSKHTGLTPHAKTAYDIREFILYIQAARTVERAARGEVDGTKMGGGFSVGDANVQFQPRGKTARCEATGICRRIRALKNRVGAELFDRLRFPVRLFSAA